MVEEYKKEGGNQLGTMREQTKEIIFYEKGFGWQ